MKQHRGERLEVLKSRIDTPSSHFHGLNRAAGLRIAGSCTKITAGSDGRLFLHSVEHSWCSPGGVACMEGIDCRWDLLFAYFHRWIQKLFFTGLGLGWRAVSVVSCFKSVTRMAPHGMTKWTALTPQTPDRAPLPQKRAQHEGTDSLLRRTHKESSARHRHRAWRPDESIN